MIRKGIILAGGSGMRLSPLTRVISKQLLPVYDKPMIYYPLSTLMLSGIREVLVISTPHDLPNYKDLLGDGSQWGMELQFTQQNSPDGIAQAFIIGSSFINGQRSALILGDNILLGHGLEDHLRSASENETGATIFVRQVEHPEDYGVMEFDAKGRPSSIIEKPSEPKSDWAVIGLYFYDKQVVDIAKSLKPSWREELEITELNACYLSQNQIHVNKLGSKIAWFDAGTHDRLLDASNFVQNLEKEQGVKIACPEEIAFNQKWISIDALEKEAKKQEKSSYGSYLKQFLNKASTFKI